MPWTKEDRSFKTLINKRTTDSIGKQHYNEYGDYTINVHSNEIWMDNIGSIPATTVSAGIAELKTLFTLTLDNSVPNYQCYYAYESGNRLKDWISTKYGDSYAVKLYDNSNAEIFPTDACQWFFDYQTGVLTFNGTVTGFTRPFKITGYRYIGAKGAGSVVNRTTKLSITGSISTGSVFNVDASGINYTMSGDIGNLGISPTHFNTIGGIQIYLNGLLQIKSQDVIWDTATTFILNHEIDNMDEIVILT